MKVVAFLTEYAVIDRIIRHLGLKFAAKKPPPARVFEQTALMSPFGCITGRSARSAARRSPGPPDLEFLTLVPGRAIAFL